MKDSMKAVKFRISVLEGASYKNVVEFDYTNQKGEESHKRVEVYDLTPTFFYGFCLEENKTKSFKYESIRNLKVGPEFKPRFEKK